MATLALVFAFFPIAYVISAAVNPTGSISAQQFILLAQMFPPLLAFVARYLLAVELGNIFPAIGLDTRLLLFLIYLGTALGMNVWLMKGYFDTLPRDMDESAEIDGASHVQIFFRMILPLATPILAVISLLTIIATFNDFIIASIILQDEENFTLAVGLTQFISGQYGARWGPFAAGALVGALPVLVLFTWLQRYLVSSLTAGAVKG